MLVYHIFVHENPKNDFGVFGKSGRFGKLVVCARPLAGRKAGRELEGGREVLLLGK